MPVLTCPNGHRWETPSGGGAECPVCGTQAARPSAGGVSTPLDGTTRLTAPPDAPPIIPGYEILGEVGRGGMGIVYQARQVSPNRIVALKVIRQDRLSHPEAVRRFQREAEAAARLSHANVVLILDSDYAGGRYFLVMEYVNGITLQQLVEQNGRLSVSQACDCIRQAALGLQHAHEMALVHRDVKPANLMIAAIGSAKTYLPGLVKILDMGVARMNHLGDGTQDLITTLTQDGAMLGTPDYIAPEQLEDARNADVRADLYSLGGTFHFLLTADVPFPGVTLIQKLDKHRWAMPTPVDQLQSDVPPAVAEVVRKLMAKKPADRFQTPAELVAALDKLTRSGYVAPGSPVPVVQASRRLIGHQEGVWSVAVSADGKRALSGGKDGTMRLWDVGTGTEARQFPKHAQEIKAVALSGDGTLAVSASGATLRLWDAATGQELGKLVGHTGTVRVAALSPDGKRLLSGGDDKVLRLWDVTTRREIRRLAGHTREITSVMVSSSGKALSGSRDQTMRLWDLTTGAEERCFAGQRGMILSVAMSPDESLALSGNFDTTLRLWDVATGKELRQFKGHKQMVSAVAFMPDGQRVISGSNDHTLRLWDLGSTREVCVFEGHTSWVTGLVVLPDGKQMISSSADKTLCLWPARDIPV